MEDKEKPTPEATPENSAPREEAAPPEPAIGAGTMIREAREKAGITIAKLCADLRISTGTLEALEAGEYGKLAGAPYVRAMLVSLSRHLHLDTKEVLKAFANDLGGGQQAAPTVQVSPYKDDSGTHAKAHKQIFILLLAVLLFILLLIMGKVNTSAPEAEPEAPPVATDTLLNIDPLPEEDSLPPVQDSAAGDSASSTAAAAAATTAATNAAATAAREAAEDKARETHVRIEALTDSVWIRILPAGKRESSRYLLKGKPQEWTHSDAITFITRQSETVEVFTGGTSVIPDKRRFKVDGDQVSY
jgi:cytoskeletal protein RodZ